MKKDVEEEFEKLAFEEQEKEVRIREKEEVKGKGRKGFKKKDELVEGFVEPDLDVKERDDFNTDKVENYEELENAISEEESQLEIEHFDENEIEGKEQ